MMYRKLVIAVVAAPFLFAGLAHAWWGGGPGNGYYGAGPVNSDARGSFSFGTSFRGRGHGQGYNRYARYPVPPHNPYLAQVPRTQSWIIRGVNFKYDSAELTPGSMEILDQVAQVVNSMPVQPLEVGGHASAEGDEPYNQELSDRRAQTVRAYLVQRGIKPELLSYRGYGETRPLVNNTTEPGRRINRRVELTPIFSAQR